MSSSNHPPQTTAVVHKLDASGLACGATHKMHSVVSRAYKSVTCKLCLRKRYKT